MCLVAKANNAVERLTAEVADLKDDLTWGMYSKDNEGQRKLRDKEEELRSAERALTAARLDSEVEPGMSVERLDRLAAERRYVNGTIEQMARRIAVLRDKCVRAFNFEGIDRHEVSEHNRDDDEEVCHDEYLHVRFLRYFMCDAESVEIAFPLAYLDDPNWEQTEQSRIDAKKTARALAADAACQLRTAERDANERAEWMRLNEKYGTPAS